MPGILVETVTAIANTGTYSSQRRYSLHFGLFKVPFGLQLLKKIGESLPI